MQKFSNVLQSHFVEPISGVVKDDGKQYFRIISYKGIGIEFSSCNIVHCNNVDQAENVIREAAATNYKKPIEDIYVNFFDVPFDVAMSCKYVWNPVTKKCYLIPVMRQRDVTYDATHLKLKMAYRRKMK